MSILNEFKNFALKGNVVDMAIGVVIGAGFGKVVTSLVEDLIMPLIALTTGGIDFSNLYWAFGNENIPLGMPLAEARTIGTVLAWGDFLTIVLNFIIIALAIFFVIKLMNKTMDKAARMTGKKEKELCKKQAAATPQDIVLLQEIRDLLAATNKKH